MSLLPLKLPQRKGPLLSLVRQVELEQSVLEILVMGRPRKRGPARAVRSQGPAQGTKDREQRTRRSPVRAVQREVPAVTGHLQAAAFGTNVGHDALVLWPGPPISLRGRVMH